MSKLALEVERDRFRLDDETRYVISGSIPKNWTIEAFLDKTPLEVRTQEAEPAGAAERFGKETLSGCKRMEAEITLPENLAEHRRLSVYAVSGKERKLWFRISAGRLAVRREKPQFYIDEKLADPAAHTLQIRGWAAAREPVQIRFFDENKKLIAAEVRRNRRIDVERMFSECDLPKDCGFYARLDGLSGKRVYLVMGCCGGKKAVCPIRLDKNGIFLEKVEKYRQKAVNYLRIYGARALVKKTFGKLSKMAERPVEYDKWLPRHLPTQEELAAERTAVFAKQPKISVVVPLYRTDKDFLRQMVDSVRNQTYANWELCLSDGSGGDSPIAGILQQLAKEDSRIRVVFHEEKLPIAQNTNAAIAVASGDFVAFLDHDDILEPHALFACVKALNERPETEILYSDEDKMSVDGLTFFQPHFKPDFNLDLLCTVNYICHLFVVKKSLLDQVGGRQPVRPEFEGAQDYDLILRCVEETKEIYHIPKILYHWRSHQSSTSENPQSKSYAFEAGQRAVQEHFRRIGIKAEVFPGEYLGLYRTRYIRDYDPLVSILIPNKDHREDLARCIRSIEEKSTYRNFEYVIVENNSEEAETFAFYEELEKSNPRVRVIYYEGEFNYSKINNFGAERARGEYLLLLNNDTEVINKDWMEELLGYCMRPDVGIVGARLYYEDNTIQHAGVVLGFGGIAGHCFVQQKREETGYCHRIICAQDYSAVTAACMMVRTSVFWQVGGFDQELAVAFNDIDFCLKVRQAGYLVVYNPYAELYHYESKSRGQEDTPEKKERFAREIAILEERWPQVFEKPDPYYNPNLTLKSQDFSLRRL